MVRALLLEVAECRGAKQVLGCGHAVLVVFEAELARILANDSDVLPAETLKALASDLAERWGKVDQVDAGEEFGDTHVLAHGFNVPASAATNL